MSVGTTRRRPIALGLVGTGPAWDDSLRDAVRRHARHAVLRGVYDAVPARADQTAREWQTTVAPSLTSLFERPDIDAVLILDTAWHGWFPLELAARFRKPSLVVSSWTGDLARLEQAHLSARETGTLLMAAMPRRHAPSTNRLRELIATKLGAPRSIAAVAAFSADQAVAQLVGLIDWCSCVLGRPPTAASSSPLSGTRRQIDLQFPSAAIQARLDCEAGDAAAGCEVLTVVCQHGTAVITGAAEIAWTVGGQETRDSLTSDRSSTEIILDQFCRRVVGGLIPVSDLSDVLRSLRLTQAVTK